MDFKDINAKLSNAIAAAMGATPGRYRAVNEPGYIKLLSAVSTAYAGHGPHMRAAGYNNLAFHMRRLGYGAETLLYAEQSIALDPGNTTQVIANMGFSAYAQGLINGDYEDGLARYAALDAYMAERGLMDDTGRIKSYQNAGQILHRMGMNDHAYYAQAQDHFEKALGVLGISETLGVSQKAQFAGQIGYCYAKTLTHMARVDAGNASALLDAAYVQIERGMAFISPLDGFDFERACFKAVKADVLAGMGQAIDASLMLGEAVSAQRAFGPTLAPRIASTLLKIARVAGEKTSIPALAMLEDFYGPKSHADVTHYLHAARLAPVI